MFTARYNDWPSHTENFKPKLTCFGKTKDQVIERVKKELIKNGRKNDVAVIYQEFEAINYLYKIGDTFKLGPAV